MKHLINIVIFALLWGVGYALGDGTLDSIKDVIAIVLFLAGFGWLYYKYA